jgi:hypothetical protein
LMFYNIGKPELGEFSDATLIEGPNGFVAERRNRDHIAFDTILPPLAGGLTNDHPTAIQPLNGAYFSDASLFFCGAFLLSSLVRYRPKFGSMRFPIRCKKTGRPMIAHFL